ncbi:hypothetical protein BG262_02665 [Floricoccus penangensis]|uniref:Uncharacterized protein n=1 Tax=Floricoccus penangensis TaxID=1859475 RepID=A0A9Q5NZL4_9LACT|nr:hypothetical protein [Floricoccus penangensis]OFI46718.1 hypothetical protein BG262_02665 [Floricoccus penangensis]
MVKKQIKIAKIINDYSFVITAGADNGIELGDKFKIIQPDEFNIVDPDTGESLGSYDLDKGTIIAKKIYDKFTICETELVKKEGGILNVANALSGSTTDYKRLDVDLDQVTGGSYTDPIVIGDVVEKITT